MWITFDFCMDNFYPIRYFFKKVRIFTNLIFPIKIDLHGIITDFMVKSVHTYGNPPFFRVDVFLMISD